MDSRAKEELLLFQRIIDRILDRSCSLADSSLIASEFQLSASKLNDLFRSHAHLTPGEWLRRMHIRQAAYDLLHTPLTIADISESFGFPDRSVFQREFIELMRMTPET